MKIYVTGGNGLIGSAIIRALKDSFKVISIDIDVPLNRLNCVEYIIMDIRKVELSRLKISAEDVIIHCAAKIPICNKKAQAIEENIEIDKNIIEIASSFNSYIIFFSSTIIYGYKDFELNISERNDLYPIDEYSNYKIQSEKKIQEHVKKALILRINAPYGTYMKNETVLLKFVKNAILNKPLMYHGSGSRKQDFTNVDDIANLIKQIIQKGHYPIGTYNISSGNPISMLELAKTIVELSKSRSEIISSGIADPQENYKASYDINKAIKELNWKPKISLKQGLLNMINNNRI